MKFYQGMTALEVVEEIFLSHAIKADKVLFRKITSIKNLEERGGLQTVEELTLHQPRNIFSPVWMARKEITTARLLNEPLIGDETLNITSRVNFRGNLSHLPLIDCECQINETNLVIIKEFIARYLNTGIILNSGRSYHIYGTKTINENEMMRLLGYCLLLKKIVDSRYIGHGLIDGEMCLRLTANKLRPQIPYVVDWVI